MTKMHFEAMAKYVAAMEDRQEASVVCEAFLWLACQFNPRFDPDRFARACGFTPK